MERKLSTSWHAEDKNLTKHGSLGFLLISRGIHHEEDATVLDKKALKTKESDTYKHAERAYLSAVYCFRTALKQKDTDERRTEIEQRIKECLTRAEYLHNQAGLNDTSEKKESGIEQIDDKTALKASSGDDSITIKPKALKQADKKKKNPASSISSTHSYVSIPTQTPSPTGSLKEHTASDKSSKNKTEINVKSKVDIDVSDKSSSKGRAKAKATHKPPLSSSSSVTMKSKPKSEKPAKEVSTPPHSHSGSGQKSDVKVAVKEANGNKQVISTAPRKKGDCASDVRIVIDIGRQRGSHNAEKKSKTSSGKDKNGRRLWPF